MKFHKLSEIFPLIQGPEFDSLVADIKTNGLHEPIIRYQGAILDGRNRFRACTKAKVKPRFEDLPKSADPVAFVISANIHRRHMNESQRAMVAARLANMPQGARTDKQPSAEMPKVDQTKAAQMMNTSERSLRNAKTVQNSGIPELVDLVDSGVIPVTRAASVAKKSDTDQKKYIKQLLTPDPRPIVEKKRGNAIIREFDAAKFEDQLVFVEARMSKLEEIIHALRTDKKAGGDHDFG